MKISTDTKILITLLGIAFAVLAVPILIACTVGLNQPAEGQKIGTVVRIAKSGVFRKTYEAEMILGGLNSGSGGFGLKPLYFTIENGEEAIALRKSMERRKEIAVWYRQEGFYLKLRSDSGGRFLQHFEETESK